MTSDGDRATYKFTTMTELSHVVSLTFLESLEGKESSNNATSQKKRDKNDEENNEKLVPLENIFIRLMTWHIDTQFQLNIKAPKEMLFQNERLPPKLCVCFCCASML